MTDGQRDQPVRGGAERGRVATSGFLGCRGADRDGSAAGQGWEKAPDVDSSLSVCGCQISREEFIWEAGWDCRGEHCLQAMVREARSIPEGADEGGGRPSWGISVGCLRVR